MEKQKILCTRSSNYFKSSTTNVEILTYRWYAFQGGEMIRSPLTFLVVRVWILDIYVWQSLLQCKILAPYKWKELLDLFCRFLSCLHNFGVSCIAKNKFLCVEGLRSQYKRENPISSQWFWIIKRENVNASAGRSFQVSNGFKPQHILVKKKIIETNALPAKESLQQNLFSSGICLRSLAL